MCKIKAILVWISLPEHSGNAAFPILNNCSCANAVSHQLFYSRFVHVSLVQACPDLQIEIKTLLTPSYFQLPCVPNAGAIVFPRTGPRLHKTQCITLERGLQGVFHSPLQSDWACSGK